MEEENIFEFEFDVERMAGVFGVSLVLEPAIDIQMMRFNKEQVQEWKMASEEKRILTSPVLIPNQKIFRNNIQGKAGYVFASADTIEKLQQNFAKQQYNHNSTIEHSTKLIEGVYFSESWIITDPKNDKANALGFGELPIGTWMMSMKVENDELWNDYIKTGKIGGFSIDGQLATKQINNNNTIKLKKMNKQTIQDIIQMSIQNVALASDLKEFKISDSLSYFASDLNEGSIITDKDGNPVPNVEFEYEGQKYKTDDMGALVALPAEDAPKDAPADAPAVEKLADVPASGDTAPADSAPSDAPAAPSIEELQAENEDLKKKIAELEVENANLQSQIVSSESDLVEFKANQPASLGIIDAPIESKKVSTKGMSKMEVIMNALKNNK
jgi:hypothetical protein